MNSLAAFFSLWYLKLILRKLIHFHLYFSTSWVAPPFSSANFETKWHFHIQFWFPPLLVLQAKMYNSEVYFWARAMWWPESLYIPYDRGFSLQILDEAWLFSVHIYCCRGNIVPWRQFQTLLFQLGGQWFRTYSLIFQSLDTCLSKRSITRPFSCRLLFDFLEELLHAFLLQPFPF
jgi:hypothetical protein